MFSHKPSSDSSPCPQMRTLLSRLSDGALHGIGRWYAERHTAHCPRCTSALIALVDLEARLVEIGNAPRPDAAALPPIKREELDPKMDRVDSGAGEATPSI